MDETLPTGDTSARAAQRPDPSTGDRTAAEPAPVDDRPPPGGVVVVWGPAGAPGRTTVALALASELGVPGHPALLVDADTYGASTAQRLGLLDEAPGVLAAVRAVDTERLDLPGLAALAPLATPGVRVLTGAPAPDRWPELRPGALERVLELGRSLCRWVVVDVASCLEQDEELSYDTMAPRRNGATLTALAHADVVVAVGGADPIGLQRLVRALPVLAEVGPAAARPVVVVNRLRAGSVGPSPRRAVQDALARWAGVDDPVLLPDDPVAADASVLQGRTLAECAPRSALRAAVGELVG
ncbi:AAA family ATPase, partial [Angustibacter aerolatus]